MELKYKNTLLRMGYYESEVKELITHHYLVLATDPVNRSTCPTILLSLIFNMAKQNPGLLERDQSLDELLSLIGTIDRKIKCNEDDLIYETCKTCLVTCGISPNVECPIHFEIHRKVDSCKSCKLRRKNSLMKIIINKKIFETEFRKNPDLYIPGTWVAVSDLRVLGRNIPDSEAAAQIRQSKPGYMAPIPYPRADNGTLFDIIRERRNLPIEPYLGAL
jgi:hypothetical protein